VNPHADSAIETTVSKSKMYPDSTRPRRPPVNISQQTTSGDIRPKPTNHDAADALF
jgi:hypothetical protein